MRFLLLICAINFFYQSIGQDTTLLVCQKSYEKGVLQNSHFNEYDEYNRCIRSYNINHITLDTTWYEQSFDDQGRLISQSTRKSNIPSYLNRDNYEYSGDTIITRNKQGERESIFKRDGKNKNRIYYSCKTNSDEGALVRQEVDSCFYNDSSRYQRCVSYEMLIYTPPKSAMVEEVWYDDEGNEYRTEEEMPLIMVPTDPGPPRLKMDGWNEAYRNEDNKVVSMTFYDKNGKYKVNNYTYDSLGRFVKSVFEDVRTGELEIHETWSETRGDTLTTYSTNNQRNGVFKNVSVTDSTNGTFVWSESYRDEVLVGRYQYVESKTEDGMVETKYYLRYAVDEFNHSSTELKEKMDRKYVNEYKSFPKAKTLD